MRSEGPDAWFAGALLLVAVVAVADVADRAGSLAGAVAIAPLVAGTMCSPRRTAVVSLVTLAVGGWLLMTQGSPPALTLTVRTGVVLTGVILGPAVAVARSRRERRIADLTRVAEAAQLAVLTPIPPVAGPVRLASLYQSASREALIGGDLYGVAETPHGVRLMIGDVRGKGIDAVRVAAVILAAFRDGTHRLSTLTDLAEHCDQRLRPHLVAEDFVTALFSDIGHDGTVEMISYGHPGPVHVRGYQMQEVEIAQPGTPLGFPADLVAAPASQHLQLRAGDRLLLYTDGLVEARTPQGGFVPVRQAIGQLGTVQFEDALAAIVARLHAVAGEVRDDLALLLLEYTGDEHTTTPGLEVSVHGRADRGPSLAPSPRH